MADFSNYAAQREDGLNALPFTFDELQGSPSVLSRPATSANTRYNNARLKSLGKRTAGGRKKIRVTSQTVEAARREDADMLSKYCVTGWGESVPMDSNGEPVPFSAENAKDFFLAIPDWMFDEFRNWVSEPLNFVPAEDAGSDDVEDDDVDEVGNSSQPASSGTSAFNETASQ